MNRIDAAISAAFVWKCIQDARGVSDETQLRRLMCCIHGMMRDLLDRLEREAKTREEGREEGGYQKPAAGSPTSLRPSQGSSRRQNLTKSLVLASSHSVL